MKKCVNVILFNQQGEVLSASRKTDHNDFGLVGGKVDPEDMDDLIAALKREVREETGLELSNIRLIHNDLYRGDLQYTYLADWSGNIHTDEPHVIKWTNFAEVVKGSFGDYNLQMAVILKEMGINFVFN